MNPLSGTVLHCLALSETRLPYWESFGTRSLSTGVCSSSSQLFMKSTRCPFAQRESLFLIREIQEFLIKTKR